jgi:hypothetical protein
VSDVTRRFILIGKATVAEDKTGVTIFTERSISLSACVQARTSEHCLPLISVVLSPQIRHRLSVSTDVIRFTGR